jgi:CBS domain-containing protein
MSKRSSDNNSDDKNEKQQKPSPWSELTKSPVSAITNSKKKLITAKETDSLKQVMDILQQENILSVPIVDKKHEFQGFVDVLDIAGYVLATWRKLSINLESTHFPSQHFFQTEIKHVLNFSHVNYPVLIDENSTIADVIELFKSPKTYFRLHRIGVVSTKGVLVNIITQSDIVNYASQHLASIANVNTSLASMRVIRSPIMVQMDTPFSEALETLFKNRISGLAIVDAEFRLAGNLSASDLRGINFLVFDIFNGSTLQFLVKQTKNIKPIQSLHAESSFGEAITTVTEQKIHRIYISAENGYPKGFISLIDIISRLQ